jgi:spore coat polysaccharide biosynthesis protein SpsF (cytidylyltransferase family)
VDLKEDLSFVRQVFRHLYKEGRIFHAEDILRLIEEHPSLAEINRGIVNNEGYEKSLLEDRLVK